jgi:hypothetical protein
VTITAAGKELFDHAHAAFEAEVAVLVAALNPTERTRFSAIASRIAVADARRRGIDIPSCAGRSGLDQRQRHEHCSPDCC